MMKEVTVSAKTVEDAVTEASIELEITSDLIEYEVIEKGSSGFLGLGSKQAVIHAWKKTKEIKDEVKKEIITEEKHVETKPASEVPVSKPKKEEKVVPQEIKEEEKEPISVEKKGRPEIELAEVTDETKKICSDFLANVLKAMDMEVVLKTEIDEEGALCIDMSGDNMGILIGKRGQTLDSLQYLVNRIANKSQEGYVRVKLDTEDYRRRRKETLENLARNIAFKVKRTKRAVSLEPMNPYERRIIHSALQSEKQVTTHSEGDEPFRRVVVTIARFR